MRARDLRRVCTVHLFGLQLYCEIPINGIKTEETDLTGTPSVLFVFSPDPKEVVAFGRYLRTYYFRMYVVIVLHSRKGACDAFQSSSIVASLDWAIACSIVGTGQSASMPIFRASITVLEHSLASISRILIELAPYFSSCFCSFCLVVHPSLR